MRWNAESDARIIALYEQDLSYAEIGHRMRIGKCSAYSRCFKLRRDGIIGYRADQERPTRRWTDAETKLALRMYYEDDLGPAEIARRLDRTSQSVRSKIHDDRGESLQFRNEPKITIPKLVLIEHDRRCAARHQSLTAAFFGDPLPGYSALDRRAQKEAA